MTLKRWLIALPLVLVAALAQSYFWVGAPLEAGEHGQIAVKVIDDRGNELMVVKSRQEAQG